VKGRLDNLHRIQQLDPERDHLQIYQTMVRFEFPYDMKLGLNLAFDRGFAIPHVAKLLAETGELTQRTQRRIDDTGLLMYEILLNGLEHPRGRAALRRINQAHRPHSIANDDYVYALAALIVIPTRWLDRYGWRRPCCHERAASHAYYRELWA
jgi:hypothetical protein